MWAPVGIVMFATGLGLMLSGEPTPLRAPHAAAGPEIPRSRYECRGARGRTVEPVTEEDLWCAA